jgi:hypothetical protein
MSITRERIASFWGLVHLPSIAAIFLCSCATGGQPPVSSPLAKQSDGDVPPIVLRGSPTIRLKPDRRYEIRQMPTTPEPDVPTKNLRIYMLVPQDEQSSAVLAIGPGGHRKTEEAIARNYQGAKVTKVAGTVRGTAVEWWHYKDDHHLYSTCYATLPDSAGVERPVYFDLVANTLDRLGALEAAFSGIELE